MSSSEPARKRLRPDPSSKPSGPPVRVLTEADKVLESVRSRGNKGVWLADIKRETGIPQNIIQKQIKQLLNSKRIKEVKDIRHKAKKVYMAAEFEPSEEITGGTWFSGGTLNTEVINDVKRRCKQQIVKVKAATADMIWKQMKKSDPNLMYTIQQIGDVLEALVLDKELEEVKSTGKGDFVNVPAGRLCYRTVQRSGGTHFGALGSVPCGVCPRLRDCTPDGVISPRNCDYYKQWLGLEFF